MFASSAISSNVYNINKSWELAQGPSDSISSLAWYPLTQNNQTFLAAGSWDKSVRVWDIHFEPLRPNLQSQPKAIFTHDGPVLGCTFSRQNALFSCSCDSTIKMHNLATNQSQNIGKHDAPVSAIAFDDDKNICISSSWDKTIKFWDCRQANPAHTINVGVKIYAMDYKFPVLIVAGSDRHVHAVNMQNLQAAPVKIETLLKMQLRTVAVTHDRKSFLCGSIEGRCAIQLFDKAQQNTVNTFAFKCHRIEERGITNSFLLYPVNSVAMHPVTHSVLITAGGDGTIAFWEVSRKTRLKCFECVKAPINQAVCDASGQMLAYSISYDWCKGYSLNDVSKSPNKILVHPVKEDMLKLSPENKR